MELDDAFNRNEYFEVVLVKPGKNALEAAPEDFERLGVTAKDPLSAQMADEVRAKAAEGYAVLFAAKPGVLTDPEIHARSRATSTTFDRTKY